MRGFLLGSIGAGLLALAAPGASAQSAPGEWNHPAALHLVTQARARRQAVAGDTALRSYTARASAFVYFYLDQEDTGERNLVKTDQLALELAWRAPRQAKQRIVGWRDRKDLPTNIRYHLDHLAVVLENFGDEIRIGDGDEVADVLHPAAPAAEDVYDYRVADSLTLRLGGAPEAVPVYRLEVRPKDPRRPGYVGSLYVDRRDGTIVRMEFTFTPASYRDRYLDYIRISLENALWRGRFWLPSRQRLELRRRLPDVDFPVGTVIRASMRVGDYAFNVDLPPETFLGPPVSVAPTRVLAGYRFTEPIDAEVRAEGLGPPVELERLQREALALARERALQRARGGLQIGPVSQILRFGREEGVAVAAGLRRRWGEGRLGLRLGLATAPRWLHGEVEFARPRLRGALYLHRPDTRPPGPVAPGVWSTLSALGGEDLRDVVFTSGLEVEAQTAMGGGVGRVRWALERQRGAPRPQTKAPFGAAYRPSLPVVAGTAARLRLRWERQDPAERAVRWQAAAEVDATRLWAVSGTYSFAWPRLETRLERRWAGAGSPALELDGVAAAALGRLPPQAVAAVGGQGTLPGQPFRVYGADRYTAWQTAFAADLVRPGLRGRLLGAVGATRAPAAVPGPLRRLDGVRGALGIGFGLFYDILRIDLWRGFGPEGRWELRVDTRRSFWDFL